MKQREKITWLCKLLEEREAGTATAMLQEYLGVLKRDRLRAMETAKENLLSLQSELCRELDLLEEWEEDISDLRGTAKQLKHDIEEHWSETP